MAVRRSVSVSRATSISVILLFTVCYLMLMTAFLNNIQPADRHGTEVELNVARAGGGVDDKDRWIELKSIGGRHAFPKQTELRYKLEELVEKQVPDFDGNTNQKHTDVISMDKNDDTSGDKISCIGESASTVNDFQSIGDVQIYSAFWDNRTNDFDNAKGEMYVRFVAIMRRSSESPPRIYCIFELISSSASVFQRHASTGDDTVQREASPIYYYEFAEHHRRPFGGFMLTCRAPTWVTQFSQLLPCAVRLSRDASSLPNASGKDIRVQVLPTFRFHEGNRTLPSLKQESHQFAVCVPPLFGQINELHLIEFIELARLQGATQLIFYHFGTPLTARLVLQHYVRKYASLVTVLPWRLTNSGTAAIWYFGQAAAIQDCLYRTMATADYTLFSDLDEYLIPSMKNVTSWAELVSALGDHPHQPPCGYKIESAFFDPNKQDEPEAGEAQDVRREVLVVAKQQRRAKMTNDVRSKCLVKPRLVFEQGIHHVSKPIMAPWGTVNLDPSIALIHHHRPCNPNYRQDCTVFVDDTSAVRYADRLIRAVNEVTRAFNVSVVNGL